MKKLLALLLALAMTLSLAACSSKTTTDTTDASTGSSTTADASTSVDTADVSADTSAVATETVTATTQYGDVNGVEAGSYEAWYAIPYAKAPVDELRWAAPVAPDSWTEALDCTQVGDKFLQMGTDEDGNSVAVGSEDCLKLDVYSKSGAENLPVLVYIHGGNNQTGTSQEINGKEIVVDEDCVYVSLNYRLGILGFNCLPALQTEDGSTGNYTLLDIAMALDWVKENIAAFGGNPDNVTISGFSAGGRDVMAMLTSPMFEGKFDKAIAFSGGMTIANEEASESQIAWAVAPLAVEDGKAEDEQAAHDWLLTTGDDVKEYLYSISSDRLAALMANAGIRMSVFPHLYGDDVVLPSEGFDTTTYNSVPLIMLTGSTEFSFFSANDAYFSSDDTANLTEDEMTAAKTFAIEYGSDMYRIFNAECSAEKMYDNYNSNIYICQIDYGSSRFSQTTIPTYGAFHGIFVPALTSENSYTAIADFSGAGYTALATDLDTYLKNFLATGDPNGDDMTEWTNWTPDSPMSMVLDAGESEATATMKDTSTTYDDIMAAMDADDTVSEDIKAGIISNVMNGRWFSSALDEHYNNETLWK